MDPTILSEIWIYLLGGGFGGFTRSVVTGKGFITLPQVVHVNGGSPHLNLGFLAPIVVGALAGLIAPYTIGINGIVSVISGYAGTDMVENLIERWITRGGNTVGDR